MSDETVTPHARISLWKAFKILAIFLGAKAVTPDALKSVLPPGYVDLTVGAALVGLLNYLKVKFSWKW